MMHELVIEEPGVLGLIPEKIRADKSPHLITIADCALASN
jgi:hypothetical protein